MAKLNLQTWARLTRLDLVELAVAIGNKSLENLKRWPKTGEGRQVKESTEKILRLLDHTFESSDLTHIFNNFENVLIELSKIRDNVFYQQFLINETYKPRNSSIVSFDDSVNKSISSIGEYISTYRPKIVATKRAVGLQVGEFEVSLPVQPIPETEVKISDLIPSQQMGPLQFEFIGGVLKLKDQLASPIEHDKPIINMAREAILKDGPDLISCLTETNCDKRVINFVESLNSNVSDNANIIQLGLLNITCSTLIKVSYDELPHIAAAKFIGYNSSIGLYVSQFPEWKRFLENAAHAEITESDFHKIYNIGKAVVEPLKRANALVDPEVPKSIELMLELFRDPSISLKRSIFGMMRSLENLFAKIFSEFALTYEAMAEGGRAGLKRTFALLVASGLILAVADLAIDLSPMAVRILQTGWMSKAPDLIKKAVDQFEL